jgi:hypothetical protein
MLQCGGQIRSAPFTVVKSYIKTVSTNNIYPFTRKLLTSILTDPKNTALQKCPTMECPHKPVHYSNKLLTSRQCKTLLVAYRGSTPALGPINFHRPHDQVRHQADMGPGARFGSYTVMLGLGVNTYGGGADKGDPSGAPAGAYSGAQVGA